MPSSEGGTSFLCGSFYSTGECFGIQVMDHVTELRQCDKLALRQIPMQALRLTANVRNPIVGACDDRERHPQVPVVALQFDR